MKKSDLFSMALQNLKNRKTRTKLTVIGVIIGTCAIVIMVSVGIGIDKMVTAQYQSDTSLNKITVYGIETDPQENEKSIPFDDRAVEYMQGIDNVKLVVPTLMVSDYVDISRGRYKCDCSIKGIDFDEMETMGYTLKDGSFAIGNKSSTVFFSDKAVTSFVDHQGNPIKYKFDENYEISECEIDVMNDVFYMSPVVNSQEGAAVQSISAVTPKRVKVGGIIKSDYTVDYNSDYAIYIDIETAKDLLKQYNKLNSVHSNDFSYSEINVYVESMENVDKVQKTLLDKGFGCYSDKEGLEYTKKVMMVVQLVLGAIGAISMFVAAFGISNTMVMSVYERTKEIGIMKVLGCNIDDIKRLFLYEAGAIGLIGGTIGVLISIAVSVIANLIAKFVVNYMGAGEADMFVCVSSVPPWLAILGILFAMMVGIVAGLSPAKRSINISALTAIHNE